MEVPIKEVVYRDIDSHIRKNMWKLIAKVCICNEIFYDYFRVINNLNSKEFDLLSFY